MLIRRSPRKLQSRFSSQRGNPRINTLISGTRFVPLAVDDEYTILSRAGTK